MTFSSMDYVPFSLGQYRNNPTGEIWFYKTKVGVSWLDNCKIDDLYYAGESGNTFGVRSEDLYNNNASFYNRRNRLRKFSGIYYGEDEVFSETNGYNGKFREGYYD